MIKSNDVNHLYGRAQAVGRISEGALPAFRARLAAVGHLLEGHPVLAIDDSADLNLPEPPDRHHLDLGLETKEFGARSFIAVAVKALEREMKRNPQSAIDRLANAKAYVISQPLTGLSPIARARLESVQRALSDFLDGVTETFAATNPGFASLARQSGLTDGKAV